MGRTMLAIAVAAATVVAGPGLSTSDAQAIDREALGSQDEPSTFHVSWVGLKAHLGMGYPFEGVPVGGGELTLFQIRWTGAFFFDPIVLGGNWPFLMHVGFAFGYPVALDEGGNRTLAIGMHVTWAPYFMGSYPLLSGVLIEYRSEMDSGLDFTFGVRTQYLGAVVTAGIGY
jgi:hypothetical protein